MAILFQWDVENGEIDEGFMVFMDKVVEYAKLHGIATQNFESRDYDFVAFEDIAVDFEYAGYIVNFDDGPCITIHSRGGVCQVVNCNNCGWSGHVTPQMEACPACKFVGALADSDPPVDDADCMCGGGLPA